MSEKVTASILVIGDEILSGSTQDINSHYLCAQLKKLGVRVCRVVVIPDDIEEISKEVLEHSNKYTFVLTTGGMGPTHDDVTYEGVAKAFGEKLFIHNEFVECLKSFFGDTFLGTSEGKLANIPESAEIHKVRVWFERWSYFPIVSVRNVFIFPGIPIYLQKVFSGLKDIFRGTLVFHTKNIFVTENEFDMISVLNKAAETFKPTVTLGSYPDIDNKHYQVMLTLESVSKRELIEAESYLRSQLLPNSIVGPHPPDSPESLKCLTDLIKIKLADGVDAFRNLVRNSIKVVKECLVNYSAEGICVSFNGGKDCTVLLHMCSLLFYQMYPKGQHKLKIFYVKSSQSFPEMDEFVKLCIARYNLQPLCYDRPIKEALKKLEIDHPEIKSILMGSRQTDPGCSSLQFFQMTDPDWPQFMRVNPLSNWSYRDIWEFLHELEVPYCSLYDKGYTSIGCQDNTLPNEQLKTESKDGEVYYRPAYLLKESDLERKGRLNSKI